MKEKILTKLQELRKDEDDLAAMEYAAERSVDLMKAFCHVSEVPEELLGVGVSLAGWMLDAGIWAASSSNAKSIREGDVSVSFAEEAFGRNVSEQEMLEYFSVELERFRRMDW